MKRFEDPFIGKPNTNWVIRIASPMGQIKSSILYSELGAIWDATLCNNQAWTWPSTGDLLVWVLAEDVLDDHDGLLHHIVDLGLDEVQQGAHTALRWLLTDRQMLSAKHRAGQRDPTKIGIIQAFNIYGDSHLAWSSQAWKSPNISKTYILHMLHSKPMTHIH